MPGINNSAENQMEPEQEISYDDFYNNYMNETHPNWNGNYPAYGTAGYYVARFFGRDQKNAESLYETYKTNLKNRNEFNAVQNANQWQKYLDDTKIQREMKDYEKAGLNPYLLINSGSLGSSSVSSGAKASYDKTEKRQKEKDSGRNAALMILAIARLAAALL